MALERLKEKFEIGEVVMSVADVRGNGEVGAPFHRLKVVVKEESIAMRVVEGAMDMERRGEHVEPEEWDALVMRKKGERGKRMMVLDVRNEYETRCGSFDGAQTALLKTDKFADLPDVVDAIRRDIGGEAAAKETEVAMFCTGGVRCEKASALMLARGFKNVYQLKGGVLGYMSAVPRSKSSWKGDCFVFDNRVAVSHASDDEVRR